MNAPAHINTVTGLPIHSRRGPSSAHRWMNCPGSVRTLEVFGLHEEESSEPAAKGTVCHNIAAECLMTSREAWEYTGKHYKEAQFDFEVDEEMVGWIDEALSIVRRLAKEYEPLGAVLYVETQVRSVHDSEAYGTADIRIEVPGVCLIILDFKFGMVRVEPDDEQLRQYGYYAYEMRGERMKGAGEPKEIKLGIIQPRLPNENDHLRWNKKPYTPEDLETWFFGDVLLALAESRDPNANLVMGDWCRFCPANTQGKCPALFKEATSLPVDAPVQTLTNEQLAELRKKANIIKKFLLGVDAEVLARLRMGQKVPGAKLVNKLGDRVWQETVELTDETTGEVTTVSVESLIKKEFGATAYSEPKLKSPAQMEKLPGGKSYTKRYAYKPDTGVTVADEDDTREPVVGLMERLDAMQQGVPV